jgi:WD40 repeat protein
MMSLAYSPSGDRIASGGNNKTICIWDSNTGKLLVGPIKGLEDMVTSVVWSSDKLYSASDKFARVFDSLSGTLLHRFKQNNYLYSVALSPKHNVLACVGRGVAQLWDAGSYEPLGHPIHQDADTWHYSVSFSPDERYLACGGNDNKITLWMVQDIVAPQLIPTLTTQHPVSNAQEETESPSSSCLDVSTLTFTHRPAHRTFIGRCYKVGGK